jgi:peroxiredoxin
MPYRCPVRHSFHRRSVAGGWAASLMGGLALACAHGASDDPVDLGSELRFELPTRDGARVRTRDYAQRLLLVDFWASWCAPCTQSIPELADLYVRLEPEGLEVLAVSLDAERADAERFLEAHEVPFDVAFDPEGTLLRRLGLDEIPSFVILDGYGRVVHRQVGASRAHAEWAIRKGLALELDDPQPR